MLSEANLSNNKFTLNDLKELTSVPSYESIFTLMPQQAFSLQSLYEKYYWKQH